MLVYRNGRLVKGVTVEAIDFKMVGRPDVCRVHIKMLGDLKDFEYDDITEIEPTPANKIIIRGEVTGRDDIENVVICSVGKVLSLSKKPVMEYIEKGLITVPGNASIQEVSRILVEKGVDRALITEEGKITGIITFREIGKGICSL